MFLGHTSPPILRPSDPAKRPQTREAVYKMTTLDDVQISVEILYVAFVGLPGTGTPTMQRVYGIATRSLRGEMARIRGDNMCQRTLRLSNRCHHTGTNRSACRLSMRPSLSPLSHRPLSPSAQRESHLCRHGYSERAMWRGKGKRRGF